MSARPDAPGPSAPDWRDAGAAAQPPFRRASTKRTLECSCGILPFDLVFENQRQRVGCVSACSPSVMSVAVEHGRFLLTAENLRRDILTEASVSSNLYLSGGDS